MFFFSMALIIVMYIKRKTYVNDQYEFKTMRSDADLCLRLIWL